MPPVRKATSEPANSDHEHETEDEDHGGDGSKRKGKKSTKSKESTQRKQQNRQAQREFRQRKQAYVKELEVRVNLLARSKDDQLEGMKLTIRTLLDENQELREVLGHLGRFIGSGLGGCLPEIGLSPEELKRLAARGRLDAVHKIIEQMDRKDSKEQDPWARKRSSSQNERAESSNPNIAASGTSGQTVATTSGNGDATESNKAKGKKRARTLASTSSLSAQPGGPDALNDMNEYLSIDPTFIAPWSQGLQDELNGSLEGVSLLSSNDQRITPRRIVRERRLLEGYPAATATTTSTTSTFGNGGMSNKNTTDLGASSSSVNGTSSISPDPPYHHNTHESTSTLEDARSEMRQLHEEANAVIRDLIISFNLSNEFWTSTDKDGVKMFVEFIMNLLSHPTDNAKLQALQLIACKSFPQGSCPPHHVRNKLENPSYHLPAALQATEIQQSIPHPPWVDSIIFSSIRDRVILLPKGRCDLPVLWNDMMDHIECHENSDCLSPANWEISEHFMKKYWYLIDENVLTISNRWRMERGERILEMKDLVPVQ